MYYLPVRVMFFLILILGHMIANNTTQDFSFFLIIPIITIISKMVIIKAIAKFSKAIGYHQPDLGTNQNNILERDWLSPA